MDLLVGRVARFVSEPWHVICTPVNCNAMKVPVFIVLVLCGNKMCPNQATVRSVLSVFFRLVCVGSKWEKHHVISQSGPAGKFATSYSLAFITPVKGYASVSGVCLTMP